MKSPNYLAITSLIAANIVPLLGIWLFEWTVGELLMVYWMENAVIGIFNIPRILMARGSTVPDHKLQQLNSKSSLKISPQAVSTVSKIFIVPFFLLHYSIFWIVHGAFVLSLFGLNILGLNLSHILITLMFIVMSHGVSFVTNFIGNKEYKFRSPQQQMFAPYNRVVILHITIMISGFLLISIPGSVLPAIVLAVLKTGVDLTSHVYSHKRVYGVK